MTVVLGWLTQSAGGSGDDRACLSVWWQGTCDSAGAWWADDDGIDVDMVNIICGNALKRIGQLMLALLLLWLGCYVE